MDQWKYVVDSSSVVIVFSFIFKVNQRFTEGNVYRQRTEPAGGSNATK